MSEAAATMAEGGYRRARTLLAELETTVDGAHAWLRLAEAYTHLGAHDAAARCAGAAVEAAPEDPDACYALATAQTVLGRFAEAEALFDRVIALRSNDWDAWANRSTLRPVRPDRNHVDALEQAYASNTDAEARIALGYALAHELEGLGYHSEAWPYLAGAARLRRGRLSYRVEGDVETMSALRAAFTPERLAGVRMETGAPGPIFIFGLPRSGTTLVDRILAAHREVASLGEIPDFVQALVRAHPGVRDKNALIAASVAMDHRALGEAYRRRVAEYDAPRAFTVDKTPLNFLYAGLIALALPEARIVHVRRGAMDSGYAMLKTLFRMGYPFSYDLDDLAAYRIAFEALMAHWHAAMPGRIVEIGYEALVADQEGQSRRLLAACGLDWDPACLAFHASTAPVATASAAQVRNPIHDRSVGLWRHHAEALEPLATALTRAGVALEALP
ncbi:MAG: sulfotransferase [Sphingomonas sp.]|jgi:tetratricopeptide (TPR) repeat protein|uniref:sulfotransferase family protein n=1 Tax=Sphingomonas sp. TaxID=28214 RepID=UPI003565CA10